MSPVVSMIQVVKTNKITCLSQQYNASGLNIKKYQEVKIDMFKYSHLVKWC